MEPSFLARCIGYGDQRFKLLVRAAGVRMRAVRYGRRVMWRRFTRDEVRAILAKLFQLRGQKALWGMRIERELVR